MCIRDRASAFSLAALAIYLGKRWSVSLYLSLGGLFLTIGYGYTLVTLWPVWLAILGKESPHNITVAIYLSWTVVITVLTLISLKAKLPKRWTILLLFSLVLPTSISIYSLTSSEWATSITHSPALGIYTLVCLLALSAVYLYYQLIFNRGVLDYLKGAITVLWVVIGMYMAVLVWLIPHAILADDGYAVTVSLLIYTISCLLYTSPSPRDRTRSRMPSSA